MALAKGQVINEVWSLVRQLGAGTFGEVWLARHTELDHEMALKIPTDPEFVRQLRNEGRLQFNLRHPNIVVTYDLKPRSDPPFVAMEFVEGKSLRQHLREKVRLPVEEALRILKQVLEAVAYAHGQGVLHRDLKPENILLTQDGMVKITDFGLGKVQEEAARSLMLSGSMSTASGHSISGTFEYMSPEQKEGEEPSVQDDIYALGILGFELVVGQRPTAAGISRGLTRAGMSAELASWLEKACDERAYRYTGVDEMLGEIPLPQLVPRKRGEESRRTSTMASAIERAGATFGTEASGQPSLPVPTGTTHRDDESSFTNTLGMRFVRAGTPGVLFCVWETRVGDYRVFDQATGRKWQKPSFPQGEDHPAVLVSWEDATAFCAWLTKKERREGRVSEGQEYRLPTDDEWSVAVGLPEEGKGSPSEKDGRIKGIYPWGTVWPPPKGAGNYHPCLRVDDFPRTSPVGCFRLNAYGLHDMGGNVWEWCEDFFEGSSGPRVLRGASWNMEDPHRLLSSYRGNAQGDRRLESLGFRCVLATKG